MKKFIGSLILCALSLPAFAVNAQQVAKVYGSLGYTSLNFKGGDGVPDFKNGALEFALGARHPENVAIELVFGGGVKDDKKTVEGSRVQFETKHYYGIYLKPYVMMSDRIELYGKLGYIKGKATLRGPGGSVTASDGDFSYGIGAAFHVEKDAAITLDYTRISDDKDGKIDGVGVAIRFNF